MVSLVGSSTGFVRALFSQVGTSFVQPTKMNLPEFTLQAGIQSSGPKPSKSNFGTATLSSDFRNYTHDEYTNGRHQYARSWSEMEFASATSANLGKLKQALGSYTSGNAIGGTYRFNLGANGLLTDSQTGHGTQFRDMQALSVDGQTVVGALKSADADKDGLISALEITQRMNALEGSEKHLLISLMGTTGVSGPDQFMQLKANGDETEITIYNTDALHSESTELKVSEDKSYSLLELKELLSILQKADFDKNGIVTEDELKKYKEILMKQREEMIKIKIDKLMMQALSTCGGANIKLEELNKEIGRVDDLLKTDKSGVSNFSKLATTLGNSEGISLGALSGAISALGAIVA